MVVVLYTFHDTVCTAKNIAMQNNWYAVRLDHDITVMDYFSAVAGSNAIGDFSKSTISNFIDAGNARSANITLGLTLL